MTTDEIYNSINTQAQARIKSVAGETPTPLKPALSLLVKLGSLAIHVEEFFSPGGSKFDKAAMDSVLYDNEVLTWLKAMDGMEFLPKKRGRNGRK